MKTLLALALLALLTFSKPTPSAYTYEFTYFPGGWILKNEYAGERYFYLYSDNPGQPHFYADWRYDDQGREGLYLIAFDNTGTCTNGIMSTDGAHWLADGISFVEGK